VADPLGNAYGTFKKLKLYKLDTVTLERNKKSGQCSGIRIVALRVVEYKKSLQ